MGEPILIAVVDLVVLEAGILDGLEEVDCLRVLLVWVSLAG